MGVESVYSRNRLAVGRKCLICGEVFEINEIGSDPRTFCAECARRLAKVLYGDRVKSPLEDND